MIKILVMILSTTVLFSLYAQDRKIWQYDFLPCSLVQNLALCDSLTKKVVDYLPLPYFGHGYYSLSQTIPTIFLKAQHNDLVAQESGIMVPGDMFQNKLPQVSDDEVLYLGIPTSFSKETYKEFLTGNYFARGDLWKKNVEFHFHFNDSDNYKSQCLIEIYGGDSRGNPAKNFEFKCDKNTANFWPRIPYLRSKIDFVLLTPFGPYGGKKIIEALYHELFKVYYPYTSDYALLRLYINDYDWGLYLISPKRGKREILNYTSLNSDEFEVLKGRDVLRFLVDRKRRKNIPYYFRFLAVNYFYQNKDFIHNLRAWGHLKNGTLSLFLHDVDEENSEQLSLGVGDFLAFHKMKDSLDGKEKCQFYNELKNLADYIVENKDYRTAIYIKWTKEINDELYGHSLRYPFFKRDDWQMINKWWNIDLPTRAEKLRVYAGTLLKENCSKSRGKI